MAWFKKPEEGDTHMSNASFNGRGVGEPPALRPEPREPRAEPRSPLQRPVDSRSIEARPLEVRAPEIRVPESAPRASVLGPTLRFRGELTADEDLIIQGSVDGAIKHTQSLTIGADGSMRGDIQARVIVIDGKVDGDLFATECVNIRATAKVKGNVFAPRVAIQDGAFFQGQVDMQPAVVAVAEPIQRPRQSAPMAAPLPPPAVEQMLNGTSALP